MRQRESSTGARQRAWDALRKKSWSSVTALAEHTACSPDGLRTFVNALKKRDYIETDETGQIILINKTGPRVPSFNVKADTFRDWNLEPPMKPITLKKSIEDSGLSISGWLAANDLEIHSATRIRHMMNGQRPVSSEIEAIVNADAAAAAAATKKKPKKPS